VGTRDNTDNCRKFLLHRYSIPGPSSPLRVVIPTELFRPTCNWRLRKFIEIHKEKEAFLVHHVNFLMIRMKRPRLELSH
jgi:hypothetical protein